jgi:hypothetical protein
MDGRNRERLSDEELRALFERLFPMGFAGSDVVEELAPVDADAELTELIGSCLWDIFSDNNDVVTRDGRVADLGSFRGSSAFIDGYLSRDRAGHHEGDDMRFYMGTAFLTGRADLTGSYKLIFRRLRMLGADWIYRGLGIEPSEPRGGDDPTEPSADVPASIKAYREVYGCDPFGLERRCSPDEPLRGITNRNRHRETAWGKRRGREVW